MAAATVGCIGFMMLKYKWNIGKTEWFKVFPFLIVAIKILIAVASDFESGIRGMHALARYDMVLYYRICTVEQGRTALWMRR